jgi:hypothetical protein
MATGSHLVSRLRSTSVDKYKRRAQLRLSGAIVGLVFVNVFAGSLVIRSENLFIAGARMTDTLLPEKQEN